MGIADIRAALTLALQPVGTISDVKMKYSRGGKDQHITFKLTAVEKNKKTVISQEEIVVPSATPLHLGIQQAAAVFVANHQLEHNK